jgi:hypothetical protein
MPIKGHPFIDRTDDERAACDDCHHPLSGTASARSSSAACVRSSIWPRDHHRLQAGPVIIVKTARGEVWTNRGPDEDWLLTVRRAGLL